MLALLQTFSVLGISAVLALTWVGVSLLVAFALALAAAMLSTPIARRGPPPPDPQGCITTLAGSIEAVRSGLPPGDYRSWSDPGLGELTARRRATCTAASRPGA